MGRNKKQPSSDIEILQEEIKNLKSINRHLERELKKQNKAPESKGSKKRQDALMQEELDERIPKCPQCGKGNITTTNLGPRVIKGCNLGCGFREVTKNGKNGQEV